MIDLVRLIGFGDNVIEKWLGVTYFEECLPDLEDDYDDLDAATDEIINEYLAGRDASDKRLDDKEDYPDN